jgi:hypothetical protein
MRLLVARAHDPLWFPSVRADDIDSFYHEHTDFTELSATVHEIEQIFGLVQLVTTEVQTHWSGKKKVPKLSLFALAFFFQDMRKNSQWKLDGPSTEKLANHTANVQVQGRSRTTDGPQIKEFYQAWAQTLPTDIGIRLDPKRNFDANDRSIIWERDARTCQVCKGIVGEAFAEYDHYPVAWALGGLTRPENGRLVHAKCHPRGKLGLHLKAEGQ